jgi:Cu/Ag efflux protein CusF
MKIKFTHFFAASALGVALFTPAMAQQTSASASNSSAAATPDLTDGEVRKVDRDARKITIKHGEIKNLDMPPMTMVFVVADSAMLKQVKAGDKVRFRAANQDGNMTVTELQARK